MTINEIFYQLSQILLFPVLGAIYLSFIYALMEMGRFFALVLMRQQGKKAFSKFQFAGNSNYPQDRALAAYPVAQFFIRQPSASLNDVEVHAFKKLELVKLVTRITPMLGLIATLIPMGPALMAMTENNVVAMSEHLRTAFSAVVLALAAASLTFLIASVKKRWYAEEIVIIEKRLASQEA